MQLYNFLNFIKGVFKYPLFLYCVRNKFFLSLFKIKFIMNYIKKIKCLIEQLNNIISFRPTLDFENTTLKSVYANGKTAETEILIDYDDILNKPAGLFLGIYPNLPALELAHPTGVPGNYANVDGGVGEAAIRYIWDVDDTSWVISGGEHLTNTSELNNDGENGIDPFITAQNVVPPVSEQIDVSAEWTGSGLVFDVTANKFPVNNLWYSATAGQVTLDPADATFDRVDIIVANTNGTVEFITGVPSVNPAEPNYDFVTQYPIKFVLVRTSSLAPDGYENISVFEEDLGEPLEWTFTPTTGVSTTTNDFHSGTLSIEGTNTNYNYAPFTRATPVDRTTLNTFSFWIKLKEDYSAGTYPGFVYLFFYNASVSPTADVILVNDGQYGFDAASLNWQKITVDLALAGVTVPLIDTIRIIPYKSGGTLGWFIDEAQLQTNTVIVVPPSSHPTNTSAFTNDGETGGSRYVEEIELDNIAKVIYVNEAYLSPGATLEDRIVAYVNTLDYPKLNTDAEIWIEYSDEPLALTPFTASLSSGDACSAPDLSPYSAALYHNGAGAYPTIGDVVTLDDLGTLPVEFSTAVQMSNLEYLRTNASGVRIEITCN